MIALAVPARTKTIVIIPEGRRGVKNSANVETNRLQATLSYCHQRYAPVSTTSAAKGDGNLSGGVLGHAILNGT